MMLTTGMDLVDCSRLKRMLTQDDSFLSLALTKAEREQCGSDVVRIGLRWAAKEAVLKSLGQGIGKVALLDIAVTHDAQGIHQVTLTGSAKAQADTLGIRKFHLTSSTATNIALALVVTTTGESDA